MRRWLSPGRLSGRRERVCRSTRAAGGAPRAPAPVAPLGIAPGYYVEEGQACGDPVGGIFFYDGRRFGMMYPSTTGPEVVAPIGRPSRRGNLWVFRDGSGVQVLSPTRIRWSYEELSPPMRLCDARRCRPRSGCADSRRLTFPPGALDGRLRSGFGPDSRPRQSVRGFLS